MSRPILFLVNSLGEGSGPLQRARHLAARGAEVHVVAFRGKGVMKSRAELTREIESLRARYERPGLSIRSLGALGYRDIRGWIRLGRLLREKDWESCVCHHSMMSTAGVVLARLMGVPRVVKMEMTSKARRGRAARWADRLAMNLADAVVCISSATRDSFPESDRRRFGSRMTVIHNGVALAEVGAVETDPAWRRRHGLPPRAPIIATVGRLHPVKNHLVMFRAMAPLQSEMPEALLVIAGRGPLTDELIDRAEELGVARAVRFLGYIPREEVYQLLATTDVFTMTSHAEGFSEALVQAMAAGKPAVLSDIPSFREAVADGQEGFLVPGDRPDMLAERWLRLLRDSEMREEMGQRARERVRRDFSMESVIDRYQVLLESAPKGSSPPR